MVENTHSGFQSRSGWEKYLDSSNWHEAAKIFPLMSERELDHLADDIKKTGLLHPITLLGEKVLDGRNRLLACAKAAVEPWFVQWKQIGELDPIEWVFCENYSRRHLSPSQAAMCVVEFLSLQKAKAKVRQVANLKRGTTQPSSQSPVTQTIGKAGGGSKHKGEATERTAQMARLFGSNTNRQYVADARAIKDSDPELAESVRQGIKTIPQAKKELGEQKERIAVTFDRKVPEDKKILDFLKTLPRKTRSDSIKEILLESIDRTRTTQVSDGAPEETGAETRASRKEDHNPSSLSYEDIDPEEFDPEELLR